jgi:predicted Fe-S protein YdhL (DUF1289 family)
VSEPVVPARHDALSADTAFEIDERQIAAWRSMSPAERRQVSREMTRAANEQVLAGIRHRYLNASERECFLRSAAVRLGVDNVRRIYPDAAALVDLDGADPIS